MRLEGVWGNGCIDSRILDLGTSWRRVVNFTPRPLYPRGKSPWCTLDRRLCGPQSRCRRHWEEKILLLQVLELWTLGRPARSKSLYRLHYLNFILGSTTILMKIQKDKLKLKLWTIFTFELKKVKFNVGFSQNWFCTFRNLWVRMKLCSLIMV
jgi:hypothetical protein